MSVQTRPSLMSLRGVLVSRGLEAAVVTRYFDHRSSATVAERGGVSEKPDRGRTYGPESVVGRSRSWDVGAPTPERTEGGVRPRKRVRGPGTGRGSFESQSERYTFVRGTRVVEDGRSRCLRARTAPSRRRRVCGLPSGTTEVLTYSVGVSSPAPTTSSGVEGRLSP